MWDGKGRAEGVLKQGEASCNTKNTQPPDPTGYKSKQKVGHCLEEEHLPTPTFHVKATKACVWGQFPEGQRRNSKGLESRCKEHIW